MATAAAPVVRVSAPVTARPEPADPIRWNRALSKAFDVTREQFPPRSAEEALVSKYLGLEIKHLERRAQSVPAVRMGAVLTAVNEILQPWALDDIRNLNRDGEETPPVYDVIRLNSTQRQDFLVDGMRFLHQGDPEAGIRATLRVEPRWFGIELTTYGARTAGTAEQLLAAIMTRAREINFLKGEAFALSGEFLPKSDETFADLFLEPTNAAAMTRVVNLINTRGKALENRGVLLMGPPGTGKTLAARIVRNQAKATFIWVSARDFYYAGSFGGFTEAFDLARECAPSVVVFEDIDNWISDRTVDLIKTEMDGVARSTGVVTMMTTNEPERLPSALIDRPGRFHDVLKFGLPDAAARTAMLARWLPALTAADRARAVKATDGYSGAHVRELARFAAIIAEQDQLPIDQALTAALTKLAEQRALITETQRTGSRFKLSPALTVKAATKQRAYSRLIIKQFDPAGRMFTGIASSATPDRAGDVVDPAGMSFRNPLPLLWQHDPQRPVGLVTLGTPNADGVPFTAILPLVPDSETVRVRIDEALASVKAGLVRGVSIGFRPDEEAITALRSGGLRFGKVEVLELSLVTIPANVDATIQAIKSFDSAPAVPGKRTAVVSLTPPAAVGPASTRGRAMKKSIADQITAFQAERTTKNTRMDAILDTAADAGVTLDDAAKEEYDRLDLEVKSIDEHLVRLLASEQRQRAAAIRVAGDDPEAAARSRAGAPVITVERKLPPGIGFARMAMCVAHAKGNLMYAQELAKAYYPDDQNIHLFLKAAVTPAMTSGGGGPAVQYTDFVDDFVNFLRPKTIVGQFGQNGIPALRRVPFNTRVSTQTAGGSAYWVGEGKPKPLTRGTFGTATIDFTKVATISVLTKEEMRFGVPSAEQKVRDDLANAVAARIDVDFVDPAKAAVAGVSPASITNGVAATAVSGTDDAAVRVDFSNLMTGPIAADIDMADGVFIMSTKTALNLSLMLNAFGQQQFPDLSITGGRLLGFPVIVSRYLTTLGSPSLNMVVFVNASDIFLADDGNVTISASDQASLEMSDAPTQNGAAGTGASLVSLWQNNMLGLLAEREINWKVRRAAAVAYLSPVAYAPTT